MCESGFIKLDRRMLDWQWYQNQNTKDVFLHMILKANWKDKKYMGIDVPRGSFVSSYAKLAGELNMSVKSVRTAIEHLKKTGEAASKGQGKYTVFTVVSYDRYQSEGQTNGKQTASKGQTNGRQSAGKGQLLRKERNKECKNNTIYSANDALNHAINDFVASRKNMRSPMTDRAIELLIKRLEKIAQNDDERIEILNRAIEGGWKTVYPIKEDKPKKKNQFDEQIEHPADGQQFTDLERQLTQNRRKHGTDRAADLQH